MLESSLWYPQGFFIACGDPHEEGRLPRAHFTWMFIMGRSGLEAYLYFVVDQEGSRGVLFLEMIFFLGGMLF